jgi:hypothetical protein
MNGAQRIFRPEAVQRYMLFQQKAVFPRLMCPRSMAFAWLALLLLLILGAIVVISVRRTGDSHVPNPTPQSVNSNQNRGSHQ